MVLSTEDLRGTAEILDPMDVYSDESDIEDAPDKDDVKKKHKSMLKDIKVLSGADKAKKKSSRTEASRELSESTWSSGNQEKLQMQDLIGTLKGTSAPVAKMKKKLNKVEKTTAVLKTPLPKPQAERIQRAVAFQGVAKRVSRWAPVVQRNRDAEVLSFPLKSYTPPVTTTTSLARSHKAENDMEREIAAVLSGSKQNLERKDKELTAAEEDALKSFDLEEAMARRKELQRARALLSYYEAKCRRVRKIKSKQFHRELKKDERKLIGKVDLDSLAKTDPELFNAELLKAEKLRAQERASLRHRNTSKWAKNLITRGHKNKTDQESIREQLRISRELTEIKTTVDSDEDIPVDHEEDTHADGADGGVRKLNLLTLDGAEDTELENLPSNPWLLGEADRDALQVQENTASKRLKRLQPIQNMDLVKEDAGENSDDEEVSSGGEWETPQQGKGKRKRLVKKSAAVKDGSARNSCEDGVDMDVNSVNDTAANTMDFESDQEYDGLPSGEEIADREAKLKKKKKVIPKKKVVKKSKKLSTAEKKATVKQQNIEQIIETEKNVAELPVCEENVEDEHISDQDTDAPGDSDERQRSLIREAFANDDVVDAFVQEKSELIDSLAPKSTDLTLPGWGEWAGAGISAPTRKRKRFTTVEKPSSSAPRSDANLSHVIIHEERNKKLAKLQVPEVPFPYTNQAEFERSLRQPIGAQWNTPSVVAKLVEPRVTTAPGQVIAPLQAGKHMKKSWKEEQKEAPPGGKKKRKGKKGKQG